MSTPVPNLHIGVIDIETYLAVDGTYKVYALGFKTNLDLKPIIYYIDQNDLEYSSKLIVLSLVDELLRSRYEDTIFYCHNLGGFDIVFILNTLFWYNDNLNLTLNDKEKPNLYKYSCGCILR